MTSSSIYGTPSCSYVVWGVTNGEKSEYGWEADAGFCKLSGFSESSSFARSYICALVFIINGQRCLCKLTVFDVSCTSKEMIN